MSEELKDVPAKPEFTVEYIQGQIADTAKQLNYHQDQVQRNLGLLNFLRDALQRFQFPHTPKPPAEVK